MAHSILIAGAGQLGSRYLQGFSRVGDPLDIWVFDIADCSLSLSRERWLECTSVKHKVHFVNSLNLLPPNIDLAIVSSTANVRLSIVKEVLEKTKVSYFLLEKVLAQSLSELSQLKSLLTSCKGVWVNTPMYMSPLYKNLRKYYNGNQAPIEMKVSGFEGMACNAIHYIDYVSRWNGAAPIAANSEGLRDQWFPAKRPGFYELEGVLKVFFEDGSALILTSKRDVSDCQISVALGDDRWEVSEQLSLATSKDAFLEGSIKLQSELSSELYDQIFYANGPDLPILDQSITQHIILLNTLIPHWKQYSQSNSDLLPIT